MIPPSASQARNYLAAAGGSGFVALWQESFVDGFSIEDDIYGARVSTAGALVDTSMLPIATALKSQSAPAAAFGSSQFLLVWTTQESGVNGITDLHGALLTP